MKNLRRLLLAASVLASLLAAAPVRAQGASEDGLTPPPRVAARSDAPPAAPKPTFKTFSLTQGKPMGGDTRFTVDANGDYEIVETGTSPDHESAFLHVIARGKLTPSELVALAKLFDDMSRAAPPENLPTDHRIMETQAIDLGWTDDQGSHSAHALTSLDQGNLSDDDKAVWSTVKPLVVAVQDLENRLVTKAHDASPKNDAAVAGPSDATPKAEAQSKGMSKVVAEKLAR